MTYRISQAQNSFNLSLSRNWNSFFISTSLRKKNEARSILIKTYILQKFQIKEAYNKIYKYKFRMSKHYEERYYTREEIADECDDYHQRSSSRRRSTSRPRHHRMPSEDHYYRQRYAKILTRCRI
jgi:hypothetical protein